MAAAPHVPDNWSHVQELHDTLPGASSLLFRNCRLPGQLTSYRVAVRRAREILAQGLARAAHVEGSLRVLDVGCGDGALFEEIRTEFPRARLIGLDSSWAELQLTRHDLGTTTSAVQADAHSMPFRSGSIDILFAHFTLNALSRPLTAISDCIRVLRPGGVFVFVVPNGAWAGTAFQEFAAALAHAQRVLGPPVRRPLPPASPNEIEGHLRTARASVHQRWAESALIHDTGTAMRGLFLSTYTYFRLAPSGRELVASYLTTSLLETVNYSCCIPMCFLAGTTSRAPA